MTSQRELALALTRLEARARQLRMEPHVDDFGTVVRVGDGVAFVDGLPGVELDEVVLFDGGVQGQVLDIGRELVGCMLFAAEERVQAGTVVRRTRDTPAMPVGEAVLGRVIDALGQPRDGLGPIAAGARRRVNGPAPGLLDREPVREPLMTGIKAIDAAIPIGLGQRELILGDRGTGKTSLAVDTMINQRSSGVVCVFVSIGSKGGAEKMVVDALRDSGALASSVVIVASAADPAPLRYLAAYAGCAVAESFAYEGRHALVVYDDLTRHAEAYREVSLLLRRPPSREAYPGDIFFVQARLMERSFKLHRRLGGGSVTALPVLETQQGNISGFVPTNVISMTDGQIYLDAGLFAEGQLPAIDIGRSVSRVGGSGQFRSLRDAGANLRLELAQYGEVRGFARFGAILDDATKAQLLRGERVTSLMEQPERRPVPLAVQVADFWALKHGLIDALSPAEVRAFESLLRELGPRYPRLDAAFRSEGEIDGESRAALERWIDAARRKVIGSRPG